MANRRGRSAGVAGGPSGSRAYLSRFRAPAWPSEPRDSCDRIGGLAGKRHLHSGSLWCGPGNWRVDDSTASRGPADQRYAFDSPSRLAQAGPAGSAMSGPHCHGLMAAEGLPPGSGRDGFGIPGSGRCCGSPRLGYPLKASRSPWMGMFQTMRPRDRLHCWRIDKETAVSAAPDHSLPKKPINRRKDLIPCVG